MPITKEKRQMYRQRVKTSKCRGVPPSPCKATDECKYTNGRVRQFCRKKYNTRRNGPARAASSKSASSSADSGFPILNLRKLKDIFNDKRLIKTRIQPTQKKRGIQNFFGLDDYKQSSSPSEPNELYKNGIQPTQKKRGIQNFFGLDDYKQSSSSSPNEIYEKPKALKVKQPTKKNMDLNDWS
jgi:hypothetical protein